MAVDGSSIASVDIKLYTAGSQTGLVVTDNTGFFSFTGLLSNTTYTITASKLGCIFTPISRIYTNLNHDLNNQDFTNGKIWSGGGVDNLASNANNWASGELPQTNDIVRFDSTSGTKGCYWDLSTTIGTLQLAVDFSTSITAVADMNVGNVAIAGGLANFNQREVDISGNYSHTGGTFTWNTGGLAVWMGSALQTISMTKFNLGSNHYGSYFADFRISGSSTVRASSGLVIDGFFHMAVGSHFEAGIGTHTLTGGSQGINPPSGVFDWDDTHGSFDPSNGTIQFNTTAGAYNVKQGAANTFNNVAAGGGGSVIAGSNLHINGALNIGEIGSTVQFDLGNGFTHTIAGSVNIGPSSLSGPPAITLGTSSTTVMGSVSVGKATFDMPGGQLLVRGPFFNVRAGGTLLFSPVSSTKLIFNDGSHLQLNGGSWIAQGPATVTSMFPGSSRYGLDINGMVNFQSTVTFESIDAAGFHLGVGANPTGLNYMKFRFGVSGGAALNFDPVTVSYVTVEAPNFDTTISTNIRAILNPLVIAVSSIDVTDSSGTNTGPAYEFDPSSIVHWGTIGAPTNINGTALNSTSIQWNWTRVNKPYGFVVMASSGGSISPILNSGATFWTEINLSTNTLYSRFIRAVTDSSQADSSSTDWATLAAPLSNASVIDIGFSSVTLSWNINTNPSNTSYAIERSTTNVSFQQLSSGTFSQLVPFIDLNLSNLTTYYYRIKALNLLGLASSSSLITVTTRGVPPPILSSISPSSAGNMGLVTFTISGANFQDPAFLVLQHDTWKVHPTSSLVRDASTIMATFNLTGMLATVWDLNVVNSDGGVSLATGENMLTITDAASSTKVSVATYVASVELTLNTPAGNSTITMSPGAMNNARVYFSEDPMTAPLSVDPSVIAVSTQTLKGLFLIPGSLKEVNAYIATGRYTQGFNSPVTLVIPYADSNNDGLVDSTPLRVSTLQIMTLDESKMTWDPLSDSSIDTVNKKAQATLHHYSVYGLFGSEAPPDLSTVKIFPSPWKRGSGGPFDASLLTIANLTESGHIQIFTIGASLVKEISYDASDGGRKTWDGRADNGSEVVSGVYLFQIKPADGNNRLFKVGIER